MRTVGNLARDKFSHRFQWKRQWPLFCWFLWAAEGASFSKYKFVQWT